MGTDNVTKWITLSSNAVMGLFVYYSIILIVCLSISVSIFVCSSKIHGIIPDEFTIALIGSLATSGIGSSIYYIRKLYKACIQKIILSPTAQDSDTLQHLGTKFYFVIRPVFSFGFAILLVTGINIGVFAVSNDPPDFSNGFTKVCMFMSFFAGFSGGHFLRLLEKKGSELLSLAFKSKEGE